MHLAEMLLNIRLHGKQDRLRSRHPFSENMEKAHAILFNSKFKKREKVREYRKWLINNQPCLFGQLAAKKKTPIFICLIEEHEILTMKKGDEDLKDTIQDHRQVWKRYALEGLSSSFLVVLVSRALAYTEPGEQLKNISRRLLELYMEVEDIKDDEIISEREYVYIRSGKGKSSSQFLKFSTLPNIFCAQGDGRWWHDHRTPGGIMLTSNALGHFIMSKDPERVIEETDKIRALEDAMRTIQNAYKGPLKKGSKGLRHCPATKLVDLVEGEATPINAKSNVAKFSPDHYEGYFHTDHLIPSVFFKPQRDPQKLYLYKDLSFRYIFDPKDDPEEHTELMTGKKVKWYEVKRDLDRLPSFVNPERIINLNERLRAQLAGWLEQRLLKRLD